MTESISVLPRAKGRLTAKGYEEHLGAIEMFCILIGMVVEWVYSFVKTHQFTHLKWMHFIAGKLTLSEIYLKFERRCRGIKVFFHLCKVQNQAKLSILLRVT